MYVYFSPDTPSEIKIKVENLEFSLYIVNNRVPVYLDGSNQFNYIILRESLEYIDAILPESAEEFEKIKQVLGDMYESKQDIILQKEFYEIQDETMIDDDISQSETELDGSDSADAIEGDEQSNSS